GTKVASGSAVSLVVSSGPTQVSVPNVVGQTQSAATSAITGAGLTLGAVTRQSSSTVAAGSVISESPPGAMKVASGSAVSLVVSSDDGTISGGGGTNSGGGGAFDSFTLAALLSSLIGGLWRARKIRDRVLHAANPAPPEVGSFRTRAAR